MVGGFDGTEFPIPDGELTGSSIKCVGSSGNAGYNSGSGSGYGKLFGTGGRCCSGCYIDSMAWLPALNISHERIMSICIKNIGDFIKYSRHWSAARCTIIGSNNGCNKVS